MDEDLRSTVWNVICEKCFPVMEKLVCDLWVDYYKRPYDEVPQARKDIYNKYGPDIKFIKEIIVQEAWYEVLNVIEFMAQRLDYNKEDFRIRMNEVFEKECFAYRFVDGLIVEMTSEEEIKEIEQAMQTEDLSIQEHLKTALDCLSRRENPDYRNSIKESISAVESLCRKITGKKTLGEALKDIEKSKIIEFNASFNIGLEKIYGFTNGPDGIRHALMEKTAIEQEDARFMLILCSSFINYIIDKANRKIPRHGS